MKALKETLALDPNQLVLFRVVRIEIVEERELPRCCAAAAKAVFNGEARRLGLSERAILEPVMLASERSID